jgi:predicted TIM-barrel fold metal-dependent hydrolase
MIIDGDGHFIEPAKVWSEYLAKPFRERAKLKFDNEGHLLRVALDELQLCTFDETYRTKERPWGPGDIFTPGGIKPGRVKGKPYEDADPGGWDGKARIAMHDANQIDAAVIFPTFGMATALVKDQAFAEAACQAVNDWAHEYASVAPDEMLIVASLPWQDPPRAARELRRAVEKLGFVAGAFMPIPAFDGRKVSDPSLDVLWQTAVELDVPVCSHMAARSDLELLGKTRASSFLTMHAAVHPLEGLMAFGSMYEGRVFDRFPKLRVGFMEATCGWVPFWTERLHEHWEQLNWTMNPPLPRAPGQVFKEQCIVGCEGEEHMVPYVQNLFGENKVVWATDYPHFDTEPPFAKDMLERDDMTDSQRDGVMARAAIEFYRLDAEKIRRSNAARKAKR